MGWSRRSRLHDRHRLPQLQKDGEAVLASGLSFALTLMTSQALQKSAGITTSNPGPARLAGVLTVAMGALSSWMVGSELCGESPLQRCRTSFAAARTVLPALGQSLGHELAHAREASLSRAAFLEADLRKRCGELGTGVLSKLDPAHVDRASEARERLSATLGPSCAKASQGLRQGLEDLQGTVGRGLQHYYHEGPMPLKGVAVSASDKIAQACDSVETALSQKISPKLDSLALGQWVTVVSWGFVPLSLCGLGAFSVLGGQAMSMSPSDVRQLGAFAHPRTGAIPATMAYATPNERKKILDIGRRFGCHSCGTRRPPAAPDGFLGFICDHQPPVIVASRHNRQLWRRLTGWKVRQQFFPHCWQCSQIQSSAVRNLKDGSARALASFAVTHYTSWRPYHFTGAFLFGGVLALDHIATAIFLHFESVASPSR